jgi:putative addiction module component (TIGR02574 family)
MPVRSRRLLGDGAERTMVAMTEAVRKVLAEAMRLDEPDRALVAAELIASLDGPPDADVETAWAAEIERRVAEIEAGTAELTAWADVREQIEREILRR